MSQSKEILAALKHGDRITPIDALNRFGCMRLASRISDLKREGHTILDKTIRNGKTHYSEYYMDVESRTLFDGHLIIERARYGGLQ